MGLLDKLTGTRAAKLGVPPVSVDELRATLLGLSRPGAPWHVRDGSEEGCDLVSEWRIVDADWYGIFFQYGLNKAFRVKMKFDEGAHEVRNIDEQAAVSWRDGGPVHEQVVVSRPDEHNRVRPRRGVHRGRRARRGLHVHVPLQRDQGPAARCGHRPRLGLEGGHMETVSASPGCPSKP